MYNLHHTEGIILSANDFGEADRIYNIYTKDFGKVSVLAKGVRLEKSKLRPHLLPLSFARVSFIEGKEFMRLTDAEEILSPLLDEKTYSAFSGACSFLERLVKGQEKDEAVWELLRSLLLNTECLIHEGFEEIFQARLLYRLGYVDSEDEIIRGNRWSDLPDQVLRVAEFKKISAQGLSASQL